MVRPERLPRGRKGSAPSWWMPWPVVALVVVTVANYVWQVPYYLHFYGRFGTSPGGLTVPLLLTFLWFLLATVLLVTRRRGGVPVMASFLVVEALFYLVHNLSGAAGRDLPRRRRRAPRRLIAGLRQHRGRSLLPGVAVRHPPTEPVRRSTHHQQPLRTGRPGPGQGRGCPLRSRERRCSHAARGAFQHAGG